MTYVYADSTAVLGPLATYAEPHCYDLCAGHANRLTVPRGWEVLRLALPETPAEPNPDDLLALAEAVREAANPVETEEPAATRRSARGSLEPPAESGETRRGHLRILRE
ncbi:hypothetical protein GCM10027562_20440 [Arthrobacter pigmenti]